MLGKGGEAERATNLSNILDGYFEQGGHHVNINVLSRDMLMDAVVRHAGGGGGGGGAGGEGVGRRSWLLGGARMGTGEGGSPGRVFARLRSHRVRHALP